MLTDPIGDMLTRIRNGAQARHPETSCPSSRLKLAVARVMSEEGFLGTPRVEARVMIRKKPSRPLVSSRGPPNAGSLH